MKMKNDPQRKWAWKVVRAACLVIVFLVLPFASALMTAACLGAVKTWLQIKIANDQIVLASALVGVAAVTLLFWLDGHSYRFTNAKRAIARWLRDHTDPPRRNE